jgi:hypothetical protein
MEKSGGREVPLLGQKNMKGSHPPRIHPLPFIQEYLLEEKERRESR